jgi:microcystin-dependent protein
MSDCFVGEVRLFAFPRVPDGWAPCNGQLVSIAQNQALFALIGTTYGGDGVTTFGLPDLRGRVPIDAGTSNQGNTYVLGQATGEEMHTLTMQEMAAHSHPLISTANAGTTAAPAQNVHLATSNVAAKTLYAPPSGIAGYDVMADCVSFEGSGQAHDNMMPTLVMNFCIALEGVFPSES